MNLTSFLANVFNELLNLFDLSPLHYQPSLEEQIPHSVTPHKGFLLLFLEGIGWFWVLICGFL